jgi:hypothetical protein
MGNTGSALCDETPSQQRMLAATLRAESAIGGEGSIFGGSASIFGVRCRQSLAGLQPSHVQVTAREAHGLLAVPLILRAAGDAGVECRETR